MIRCFLALEPDDAARRDLHDVAATLDMTGWRQTSAEQYHITLKFLGDVDPDEIQKVCDAARRASANVGRISLAGTRVETMPNDRRPRTLAAMFQPDTQIAELVEQLEILLADAGFAMERRGYRPHVTLARKSRTGNRPHRLAEQMTLDHITIEADEMALVQSLLTDQGPIYRVMERFGLSAKA